MQSRMAKALRDLDYVRFAIELVLVIAGVLIALQLTAWAEARQTQAGLTQILSRLDEETAINLVIIDDMLARYEAGEADRNAAMGHLHTCEGGDAALALIAGSVSAMTSDFDPTFVTRTAEELARQDRYLDRLSEPFRAALNTYQARLIEDDTQTTTNFGLIWDVHPFHHPAIDADFSQSESSSGMQIAVPLEEICVDAEFRRRFMLASGLIRGLDLRLSVLREEALEFRTALDEERGLPSREDESD